MINAYDLIRAAALVIGLGYSARQDRKTWMWSDSVLWSAYGLALFIFPGSLFPGNESAVMSYVTRMLASLMLGMSISWYLSRRSRDENVIGAFLWSRLVGSLLFVLLTSYFYFNYSSKFSDKSVYFDMLAFVMLFLTTLYQMWRGEYRVGGRELKGNISVMCRLCFLIILMSGLAQLAYPSFIISFTKLELMENLTVRLTGCVSIGYALVWMLATSFRYDEDRSSVFLASLATMMGALITVNIAYFCDDLLTPKDALWLHAGFLPWIVVIAGLYMIWRKDSGTQSEYNLRSKSQ